MSERECSIKIKPRWDREVCVGMGCRGLQNRQRYPIWVLRIADRVRLPDPAR